MIILMGVPGFFLWLIKKYKNKQFMFNASEYKGDVKWLCLDANCLVHPKCFEVLGENSNFNDFNILEDKMINRSIEYIEKLVSIIKPSEGLYIAIDGVAPIAKIKQQRSRRFKSVNDRSLNEKIKKKHNMEITNYWSNSCITPGTDFMLKLTEKIKNWCSNQKYKIIFSSGATPSEGEHKILDFIRNRTEQNLSGPYVIYGLDADLIFLSLALNRDDLYLMRESMHLSKDGNEILNLIDLEVMKECIVETMKIYVEDMVRKPCDKDLINDFIFICYFLGNDFLPHYSSLDIYQDGLDILLKTYNETINKTQLPILEYNKKVKINQKTLIEFNRLLAEQEEDILKKLPYKKTHYPPLTGNNYEREMQRIENLRFKINDPIKLGVGEFDDYKSRYYKYYFNDDSHDNLVKICYEYIKGLVWVTKYYFEGVPSWNYYYPYDHSPFLVDLLKIVSLIDMSKIKFKKGEPLKPLEQLLAVLPPQSNFLLPKELRGLFNENSRIGYLYPLNFEQDLLYKRKYWQGIPKLPYLEINEIKKVFKIYENRLQNEDKKKNIIKEEFIFN